MTEFMKPSFSSRASSDSFREKYPMYDKYAEALANKQERPCWHASGCKEPCHPDGAGFCERHAREVGILKAEPASPSTKPPLRSCNLHVDCDAADERFKANGVRPEHCHDDCCPDCFGS